MHSNLSRQVKAFQNLSWTQLAVSIDDQPVRFRPVPVTEWPNPVRGPGAWTVTGHQLSRLEKGKKKRTTFV